VKDIALIDYGAGNLASVRKGFSAVGAYLYSPSRPADLAHAKAIVVPGVGHFQATRALSESWTTSIRAAVADGTPVLGICLGLQWLFEASDESPDVPGLALLEGRCTRLPEGQKVPHVGWNALTVTRQSRLLSGVESGTQVYFAHAFAAPVTADCVAVTRHGRDFAAVVERDAVFGVQFHPEKSSAAGLRLLENFVELVGTASVASR
jgi:imidazole glycerol-phosphate synthase subunit HisH